MTRSLAHRGLKRFGAVRQSGDAGSAGAAMSRLAADATVGTGGGVDPRGVMAAGFLRLVRSLEEGLRRPIVPLAGGRYHASQRVVHG